MQLIRSSALVLRLVEAARAVGTGRLSPESLMPVTEALDAFSSPADLGLTASEPVFTQFPAARVGPPCIRYLPIAEESTFTIGVFCFPPNCAMPLHGHPLPTPASPLPAHHP